MPPTPLPFLESKTHSRNSDAILSSRRETRSFIALSKKHHPDHNQSDPTASTRFVAISEAYATLGSAEQRAKYDRTISVASRSRTTSGSYSSAAGASPAGGRPASGLSRRRTRFQGPPPSFYRSGGWGEQSAKRTEYQAGTRDDLGSQRDGWKGTSGRDYDVPHFDRDGHFRTQETVQARWKSRVREEKQPEEDESGSPVVSFLLVGGALSLIVWTSGILRAAAQAS